MDCRAAPPVRHGYQATAGASATGLRIRASLPGLATAFRSFGDDWCKGYAQAAFLILRYSASRKSDHLMRMVPPSIYEEAAEEHDAAVLHTLSLLMHASDPLRLDAHRDEDDEDALHLARVQAMLPVAAGGCGLGSAMLTSNVAYVSSWIDYLRFMREHPSLFPTLLPLISSELLEDSGMQAVVELRDAWDVCTCAL